MQDLIDNCLGFHAQYMQQRRLAAALSTATSLQRLEPQVQSLQLYTAGTITQETLLTSCLLVRCWAMSLT